MASTVTNSFDADKLHQPIVVAVKRVPRIPLGKDNSKVLDNYCLNNYTIGAKLVPIFAGVCTAEKEGRGLYPQINHFFRIMLDEQTDAFSFSLKIDN